MGELSDPQARVLTANGIKPHKNNKTSESA
jgi:hypothetical protein